MELVKRQVSFLFMVMCKLLGVVVLENSVQLDYLPFIEKGVHILFLQIKKKVERSDVKDLKYCEDVKKSCSKFQYAYTLDEERTLEHIFWSLLVLIDTKNIVRLLCLMLHTRSIHLRHRLGFLWVFFGCALLLNETIYVFCWVMKVLLPSTIFCPLSFFPFVLKL